MIRNLCLITAIGASMTACGGDEPTSCALGQLDGSWFIEYTEMNGNCGAIPAEVVVDGGVPNECVVITNKLSSDLCDLAMRYECPTSDNQGSTEWSVAVTQDGELINGLATLQLSHARASCQSTYWLRMRRLQ